MCLSNSVLLKHMLVFFALFTISQLPKQGIRWQVSRDHMLFDWIAGSSQVNKGWVV